jgi:hypothetical protein
MRVFQMKNATVSNTKVSFIIWQGTLNIPQRVERNRW